MFIIFDLETSGLDTKTDRIVAIAASAGGQEFSTLVNPGRRIPGAATRVHGITNRMAARAPPWAEAGRAFWAFVRRASAGAEEVTFAGHNAARFDYPLLLRETARMSPPPEWLPARVRLVDTLAVCRAELRLMKTHRQAAVYEELFGRAPEGQHDALGDVRALARILGHPPLARRAPAMAREVSPPVCGDSTASREPKRPPERKQTHAHPTPEQPPEDKQPPARLTPEQPPEDDQLPVHLQKTLPPADPAPCASRTLALKKVGSSFGACALCGRTVSTHFKHSLCAE
jgi:hypothetical protein